MDFETPEADAAEQALQARPSPEDDAGSEDEHDPAVLPEPRDDADPADVADQRRIVPDEHPDERD